MLFFFFQAEDGIRDTSVTGVQTCALPICSRSPDITRRSLSGQCAEISHPAMGYLCWPGGWLTSDLRSEERRVGKECRSRRAPDGYKKKKLYLQSNCVKSRITTSVRL